MSDMNVSSVSGSAGGQPVRALPAADVDQTASQVQSKSAASRTSDTVALSSSSSSFYVEEQQSGDQLATLVMMLMHFLLNPGEDEEDNKDPMAALVGLALLSSLSQSGGRVSYFESHSSQVTQSVTTTNASAVQASAYQRSSGDATATKPNVGGNIDVSG